MTREQKKQKRNEVLTIMGLMALLVFTTRLWPILLLMMIGVFAYALWLLFHLETEATRTAIAAAFGSACTSFGGNGTGRRIFATAEADH